jgi:hypothetical protein
MGVQGTSHVETYNVLQKISFRIAFVLRIKEYPQIFSALAQATWNWNILVVYSYICSE